MRLLFWTVVLLGIPSFANGSACYRHSGCWEGSLSAAYIIPAPNVSLPGWSVRGEGLQLRKDVISNGRSVLLRSRPWSRATSGALWHKESAASWKGKVFLLKAELRPGNLNGEAHLVVLARDAQGAVVAEQKSPSLAGTTPFSKMGVGLTVPETAVTVEAAVVVEGRGAVYVRSLRVDAVAAAPATS